MALAFTIHGFSTLLYMYAVCTYFLNSVRGENLIMGKLIGRGNTRNEALTDGFGLVDLDFDEAFNITDVKV